MLNSFIESEDLRNSGVWVHIPDDEMSFKLRRTGTLLANSKLKEIKRALFGVDYSEIGLSDDQRQEASIYFLCDYVIADWENLKIDEDGEEIPYSKMECIQQFYKNKMLWDSLCAYLLMRSSDYTNYLANLLEEDKQSAKKP